MLPFDLLKVSPSDSPHCKSPYPPKGKPGKEANGQPRSPVADPRPPARLNILSAAFLVQGTRTYSSRWMRGGEEKKKNRQRKWGRAGLSGKGSPWHTAAYGQPFGPDSISQSALGSELVGGFLCASLPYVVPDSHCILSGQKAMMSPAGL